MPLINFFISRQYNILSHLPEAVILIDENGKIKYANKSALNLLETSKLQGKNINDYFLISSDNIIKNKDEEIKQILKIITEKQNSRTADVKVTDVSSGRNKRYILTIADNTHEHSLIDELTAERQNRKLLNSTKNVLLSKLDSYLCPPLHSISGFSQAMLSGLSGELNEKQRKYLEIINSNSDELLLFISRLIELSQAESDIYKLEFSNFDIVSVLSAAVSEFQVKLQNRDVKLSVNTSDLISAACYSDKNTMNRVFVNLLENASAMIETGSISITLANPPQEFLLSQGIEINENVLEKSYIICEILCRGVDGSLFNDDDIFNPYIQADKNSKKYLLQSLLLGSTRKLLEKIKGNIKVSSRYSNQVSFLFFAPADKAVLEA